MNTQEISTLVERAKAVAKVSDDGLEQILVVSRSTVATWISGQSVPLPRHLKKLQRIAEGRVSGIWRRPVGQQELDELLNQASINNQCTDGELAKLLGVSRSTITKWKMGDTCPSSKHLKRLCDLADKLAPNRDAKSSSVNFTEAGLAALTHYVRSIARDPDFDFCIELLHQYE